MKLTRLAGGTALAAVLATSLAACSDDRPSDALTIGDDAGASEPNDDEQEADEQEDPFERAGRLLTAAEIRRALPTVKELPTGWSRDSETEEDDDEEDEEISPPRCEDVFGDNTESKAALKEERAFKADEWGPFISVEIGTFDDEVPDDALDEVVDALSTCKKFSSVDAEGSKTTYRAEALSFPNLGEETLAVRMDLKTEFLPASVDVVMVRVGHNLIMLSNASLGGGELDPKLMEKIARSTVERLSS